MIQGEAMRRARKAAGLSGRQLAELSGVAHTTIYLLENPHNTRSGMLETVELLADALGLSIDEYVGHEVRKIE